MPTKKKTISVRLEPKLAKDSERSMAWHINRLVEDNIDELESRLARINEGLADFAAGRVHDAEEVMAKLFAQLEERRAAGARTTG